MSMASTIMRIRPSVLFDVEVQLVQKPVINRGEEQACEGEEGYAAEQCL